jgi:hypothetical protein
MLLLSGTGRKQVVCFICSFVYLLKFPGRKGQPSRVKHGMALGTPMLVNSNLVFLSLPRL